MNTSAYSGPLASQLDRFLSHKRSLGFAYCTEARLLSHLDRLAVAEPADAILDEPLVRRFVSDGTRGCRSHRLTVVRQLARFLAIEEPRTFVPPRRFLGIRRSRPVIRILSRLQPADFRLERMPLVCITGKGRKQRIVPLLPATAKLVGNHLAETGRSPHDTTPLFRNYRDRPMTRSGVAFLLDKYRRSATETLPSLRRRGISPHTLRHTKAMHLLHAGVTPVTIKDILGHAHLKTLDIYVQADLEMKRKAIEGTPSPVKSLPPARRRQPDLLRWLEEL